MTTTNTVEKNCWGGKSTKTSTDLLEVVLVLCTTKKTYKMLFFYRSRDRFTVHINNEETCLNVLSTIDLATVLIFKF